MEYVRLGNSGLQVSKICVGCMSFGTPGKLFDWCVGKETSKAIIKQALDLGINFFDTANVYSDGEAEEILGEAIKEFGNREEVVIATKCGINMHKDHGPNLTGLSRKHIFQEVEKSLKRLGTDYIDLYIIHHPDPNTPLEETMCALNDLVRMGKVRYIGASNFKAWQFAKAQHIAELNGWTKFISLENTHNLFEREDERELFPMLEDMGVSLTAYKIFNGGRMARNKDEETERSKTQHGSLNESNAEIQRRIEELAEKKNVSKGDIIVSYELSKKPIDVVIVGTTKPERLIDTCKALDVTLSNEEIAYLEEPYVHA